MRDDETTVQHSGAAIDVATTPGDQPIVALSNQPRASQRGPHTFAAGETIGGKYRIVEFLAEGGSGEVYKAQAPSGELVAIKTLKRSVVADEEALKRFMREGILGRRVVHHNLCQTHDIDTHHRLAADGTPDDVQFLVMELLERTLADRLREGPFTPEEALPVVRQIAAALTALHDNDIAHRDLKPANIFLQPGPRKTRVAVSDFGIAIRTIDSGTEGGERFTETGAFIGTAAYMAPEQMEGKKNIGPAADIYALGVVMFEMVTGKLPFTAPSVVELIRKKDTEKAPSPRQYVPTLDEKWEETILCCLERLPEDRFQNADDIVLGLGGEPVPSSRRRRKTRWLIAAAIAALMTLGTAGYVLTRDPPSGPVTPAAQHRRTSVAVLGLKNLGAPEERWRSTALAAMLQSEIGAGDKLRTIPGENVMRAMRDLTIADSDSLARDTLQTLHRNLGADFVVLGSYLVEGEKIRVELRLQDVRTGDVLIAHPESGPANDLSSLAARAGARVRGRLGVGELVSAADAREAQSAFPSNLDAARAYSEGLASLSVFDALAARAHFQRAVDSQPDHPMIHSALASTWSALGYDRRARGAARRAFELSQNLSRKERLRIEGQLHETNNDWNKAVETYKALQIVYPDLDFGLALAAAQTAAGKGDDAFATIEALQKLPAPDSEDPRIDLAEAAAAKAVTNFDRQLAAANRAAAKAQTLGAKLLLAQARLAAGSALVNIGELEKARQFSAEASRLFEAAGDRGNVARAQNIIAVAHANEGHSALAMESFRRSLETFRSIGDQRGIAAQLTNVGNTLADLARQPEALRVYREALAVATDVEDRVAIMRAHNNIGSALEEMGDLRGALAAFEKARDGYRDTGETLNEAKAIANIGWVYYRQKRLAEAKAEYERSLAMTRPIASASIDTADALADFAKVLADLNDLAGAHRTADEAAALFRAAEDPESETRTYNELADLYQKRGNAGEAARLREKARRVAKVATSAP